MPPTPRLLVVDDDRDAVAIHSAMFEFGGFVVVTVDDGADACAAALTHQPDAILLDLHLPHSNGEQIAAALYDDARCTHIPIVVVSADFRALSLTFPPNVRRVLLKPLEPRAVLAAVREVLSDAGS